MRGLWAPGRGVLLLGLALTGVVSLINGPSAFAAETHVFDPLLSLTGSCNVSTIDTVPDPAIPPCPEEVAGAHPPQAFRSPRSITTDSYGNIYVASYGKEEAAGAEGRIDIFDSKGFFITEVLDPRGPKDIAVDSEGNLYVFEFHVTTETSPALSNIARFEPTMYNPAAGEIAYKEPPVFVADGGNFLTSLAIDPDNDHLFVRRQHNIAEYRSAAEGNGLVEEFAGGTLTGSFNGLGLAVDATRGRIYTNDPQSSGSHTIKVFELAPPHGVLMTVGRSATPLGGEFGLEASIAVDEGTGHFFVYDQNTPTMVFEFDESGKYVSTIEFKFNRVFGADIDIDNGPFSPNGALNPKERYLYVPSHPSGIGHSFAFGPQPNGPPAIESTSVGEVAATEALLRAKINPEGLETTYKIEYTAEESFEGEGVVLAGQGVLPPGTAGIDVSALADGLEPATSYRFRVTATNEEGEEEEEGEFTTYPTESLEPCPNDAVRIGPSALLPDCRVDELVTPPDTNARAPLGVGYLGTYFATREASPDGDAVNFEIEGGAIPGYEATGSYAGDPYLARRTEKGWTTEYTGPSAAESSAILPGSNSPDQGYSFWSVNGIGSAAVEEKLTTYVRYPDGRDELVGRGSLNTDPQAEGKLISENGGHIVFVSRNFVAHTAVQLEENAPPGGTDAIYDRTADEVTHVVSLLPENEIPTEGEDAKYVGASLDGKGVAFTIGSTLYFRYNNEETHEVGENVTFAGIAEGGKRIFYVEGGNLYAYEVGGTENPIAFSTTGDVTPVNVSADGAAAYFVSPSVLGEENPNEEVAQPGQKNLYLSEEGTISFVGTVTERDVEGENPGNIEVGGLGLWTDAVSSGSNGSAGRYAIDPSRTTPNGSVIVFESRANLTEYDSEGFAEVYRYDSVGGELQCLSCNPTGASASSDASLQSISQEQGAPEPFGPYAFVANLRPDGRRVFFQSNEALVLGDTDGLQDVYEWEDDGVGTCEEEGGCLYLISYGHSDRVDYLYAASDSGDDVFFISSDLLTGADTDETPSIYDARVGVDGGSTEEGNPCCSAPLNPPALPEPATGVEGPPGNYQGIKCPKGMRKVVRGGKERCVRKRKHHHRKHHGKAGAKRRGAGR